MEYYIGQIMLWAADQVPQGWDKCAGQILQVNEHQALFSIISNRYGGDGIKTFALPDLRGRVPLGHGTGHGLSDHILASKGGAELVTLTISQLPAHTHTMKSAGTPDKPTATLNALSGSTTQNADPAGNMLGVDDAVNAAIYAKSGGGGAKVALSTDAITINAPSLYTNDDTGRNEQHNNMQPYLCLNYIIAVSGGEYPPLQW